MLTAAKKVLSFEMTIAEWIGTAVILAVPYLIVGMVWTAVGGAHLGGQGQSRIVSILGSIVSWPVLIVSDRKSVV